EKGRAQYKIQYERGAAQRKARTRRWKVANQAHLNAANARREAAKLLATPAWADLGALEAIYRDADRMSRETGIQHDVDHICPLQGKTVCGLHVAHNLQ